MQNIAYFTLSNVLPTYLFYIYSTPKFCAVAGDTPINMNFILKLEKHTLGKEFWHYRIKYYNCVGKCPH